MSKLIDIQPNMGITFKDPKGVIYAFTYDQLVEYLCSKSKRQSYQKLTTLHKSLAAYKSILLSGVMGAQQKPVERTEVIDRVIGKLKKSSITTIMNMNTQTIHLLMMIKGLDEATPEQVDKINSYLEKRFK